MKPKDIIRYNEALDAVQRGCILTDNLLEIYNQFCSSIVVREEDNQGFSLGAWFPEVGDAMAKAIAKAAKANVETNQRYLDMVTELAAQVKPKSLRVKGGMA